MNDIRVDDKQVKAFIVDLNRFTRRSVRGIEELADQYAEMLQQEVISNASGRPGPRKITGDYISTIKIHKDVHRSGLKIHVVEYVYTDAPQGPRLEYGFVGSDKAGRIYHQPPFPHWQPAYEKIAPQFPDAISGSVRKWWNG